MTSKNRMSGFALAAAAAAMFAAAPVTVSAAEHGSADEAKGKCMGGNQCKGQSACATADTSCAGQNACKGEGWVRTTKEECEELGGTFQKS